MIDFDGLTHAFGSADDVPAKLDALEALEVLPSRWQDEPLGSLWDALCHQTSTFDASYAALPRLVAIVEERPADQRAATLHLVGSIAAWQERGAGVPAELRAPYDAARQRAADVIEQTVREAPPTTLRGELLWLADLVACRGPASLGRALMALESGEFDVLCPCGHRETLGVSEVGIEIAPLVWRLRPSVDRPAAATERWGELAGSLRLEAGRRVVAELGGSLECPSCGAALGLLHGIALAAP